MSKKHVVLSLTGLVIGVSLIILGLTGYFTTEPDETPTHDGSLSVQQWYKLLEDRDYLPSFIDTCINQANGNYTSRIDSSINEHHYCHIPPYIAEFSPQLDRYGNPASQDRNYENCWEFENYPDCPQEILDSKKQKEMDMICEKKNYPYYDLEMDRCYWMGYRSDNGTKIQDVKMFATATETHTELAMIAKMNCNNNGGAWMDDSCWIKAPDNENYCLDMGKYLGYGELWRNLDDPTDEVCYGDNYLDELREQIDYQKMKTVLDNLD